MKINYTDMATHIKNISLQSNIMVVVADNVDRQKILKMCPNTFGTLKCKINTRNGISVTNISRAIRRLVESKKNILVTSKQFNYIDYKTLISIGDYDVIFTDFGKWLYPSEPISQEDKETLLEFYCEIVSEEDVTYIKWKPECIGYSGRFDIYKFMCLRSNKCWFDSKDSSIKCEIDPSRILYYFKNYLLAPQIRSDELRHSFSCASNLVL